MLKLQIAIVVLLIGIAGNMTFNDANAQQSQYCTYVHDAVWPDYKGIYVKECFK